MNIDDKYDVLGRRTAKIVDAHWARRNGGSARVGTGTPADQLQEANTMIDYHDATLLKMDLDWETSKATFVTRPCGPTPRTVAIEISGVFSIQVERSFPWGRSVSINALDTVTQDDGAVMLHVEVQSGDNILVRGTLVEERDVSE